MKASIIYIIIFIVGSPKIGHSQMVKKEIERFSSTVAYLYSEKIESTVVNGEEVEIWFKNAKTGKFHPKLNTKTGSGFFMHTADRYSNYLVTAAHVAENTNLNTKVVVKGKNGRSIVKKLTDISYMHKLNWNYSTVSDVAILLLETTFFTGIENDVISLSFNFLESNYKPDRTREVTCIGFPLDIGFKIQFLREWGFDSPRGYNN